MNRLAKLPRNFRLDRIGNRLRKALLVTPQTKQSRAWIERNLRRWRRLIYVHSPFRPHPNEAQR